MCPHANNLYDLFFGKNLIYQSVLNINPPGIGTTLDLQQVFRMKVDFGRGFPGS